MKNFLCIAFLATAFCARAYSQTEAKPAESTADSSPSGVVVATPSAAPAASPSPSASVQSLTSESAPAAASANSPQPAPSVSETSAALIPPGNAAASVDPNSETGKAATGSGEPVKESSLSDAPGSIGGTAAPADAPLPTGPSDSSEAPAAQGPKKTDAAMPDSAFTEPNSFVPEETKSPEIPTSTATKENESEKLRMARLHYRKAKTEALKNADIRSLLNQAEKATSDGDRRAAYRKYYELLNKKISELDPSTADYTKDMFTAQLDRLKEDKVEPTIPLSPPPTPEPLH